MADNMFDRFRPRSAGRKSGRDADTLWTTPWAYRDESALYVGHNGQVWLYRTLPVSPIDWEDASTRITIGQQLGTLLAEIGATSVAPVGGIKQTGSNREVHIVSVTWDAPAEPPAETAPELAEYQRAVLNFAAPRRALFLGVRLRQSTPAARPNGLIDQARQVATKLLLEDVPDRTAYNQDRDFVNGICARFGGRLPTDDELGQLESWFNNGKGPDTTIIEETTSLDVPAFDTFEMAAVMRFNQPSLPSPSTQWVLEAAAHPHGPRMISVRAELEPAAVTRARARRSQRRVDSSIQEEKAAGDLERVEYSSTFQMAKELERFLVDVGEPILSSTSIILARPVRPADETYIDFLRNKYGIEIKPLEHRQVRALDESLPTSSRRINPFLQDVSISMVAHAGLAGFSNLGDRTGGYVGLAQPDYTPVFLDYNGASRENLPPAMLVAGEPGSGKTMLCQLLALQATLAGQSAIFINPKGYDSLAPFAELVNGRIVAMSALEERPGAFDPFRYAPPTVAAEIATNFILSVLGNDGGFTQGQQLELGSALKRAALAGARCVADAFDFLDDQSIITQIRQQIEGSSLFALGIALEPLEPLTGSGGLTLIEFDRPLDLPDPAKASASHTRPERISLAAMRLVTRAAMEILMSTNGGLLVVDEAWTFLGSTEGLAALQRLGREGRSLNVLPIFATQRIADAISRDMESYLSRVFCLKMTDQREAIAALTLCGLDPTPARLNWLRDCGPRRADGDIPARPAMALHRDLKGRHSAVLLGPIPESVILALSTNPEDRKVRYEAGMEPPGSNQ